MDSNAPSTRLVFVVGVFRSGTSLLYSLLNQHPQIALMYECDVWDFPKAFFPQRFRGRWLERQEFYNQALSRHRLIPNGELGGLEHIRTPVDLYRLHAQQKGALLGGEKSPVYAVRLSHLAHQYPQGHFILIWRDPLEVYRSMQAAGRCSCFFRRPGMLCRLIEHQEQMIAQAARLESAGVPVLHVQYDRLVDQTGAACQDLCQFLHLKFDPAMTGLAHADFSAVYTGPQHDFLRRGVIEHRPADPIALSPAVSRKLIRFRQRWERLGRRTLSSKPVPPGTREPGMVELGFHWLAGQWLGWLDGSKRMLFEFLPLPWLRTYRQFKDWLSVPADATRRASLGAEFQRHYITILVSFLVLAAVAYFDYLTGPNLSCGPLYLIPCAVLALVAGLPWASIAALTAALSITALQQEIGHDFNSWLSVTLVWNLAMQFILFQFFILLLDRIRRHWNAHEARRNGPRPD